MSALAKTYVQTLHSIRPAIKKIVSVESSSLPDRNYKSASLWLRSLASIYDIEDMIALDIPWWNMAAITRVEAFLSGKKLARVFEFGSGASTIWLARRAAHVTSVEHDMGWHKVVAEQLAPYKGAKVELVPADPDFNDNPLWQSQKKGHKNKSYFNYANALRQTEAPFDLIVIDGRARAGCLSVAVKHLADDGMIVFDNAARKRYKEALRSCGLQAEWHTGLTACLPYPDTTVLLRKT